MECSSDKCRICWTSNINDKLTPIYEKQGVALKIFLCFQIKLVEYRSEGLPALICSKCLYELEIASSFRCKIMKSEKLLRKKFRNTEFEILNKFSGQEVDIKIEGQSIKTEPCDGTFELVENIFINPLSTFEDINIRCYADTETPSPKMKSSKRSNGSNKLNQTQLNPIKTHKEQTFNCKYCDKSFKYNSNLSRHRTQAHSDRKIKSVTKGKKKDQLIKNDVDSLYCQICKQFFATRGSLQKHIKIKHQHDVTERFVCDYCGDLFVIKYFLLRHIRIRHFNMNGEKRQVDSPIPCEVCGKILKSRGLLKPHMRSHQVMTPNDYWYCDLCPRKFKTKGGCTWHIQQRHVLKATFKCPYDNCSVVYKGKWELKCHIKSKHTNQRDFRCEMCGKGFIDKQKLQIHTRIHTGERPYACHLCTATFIHQTDLRRHIWGHTGERPIKCEVPNCGKGFMKNSELLNHTNRCHPTLANTSNYAM